MSRVITWPPVAITRMEWTLSAPIATSRSLLTGRRFVSAAKRERRLAAVTVGGLARFGAGYMEALKDYLRGGEDLVRLHSTRNSLLQPNIDDRLRRRDIIGWQAGGGPIPPMTWEDASEDTILWTTGATLPATTGTDGDGFPIVTITGLPARTLVGAPGEFVEVFNGTGLDAAREVRRMARWAYADSSGVAVVRVTRAFTLASVVRAALGARDEGVFEVVGDLPRAMQPVGADFSYEWEFMEVFADEVQGGEFVEFNPWV